MADKKASDGQENEDSYAVTIPIEMIDKLKRREKQKVVVKMKGKSIIVRDWK